MIEGESRTFEIDYCPTSEDILAYLRYQEELPGSVWTETAFSLLRVVGSAILFACFFHFREGLEWLSTGLLAVAFLPVLIAFERHNARETRRRRNRRVKARLEKQLAQTTFPPARFHFSPEGIALVTADKRADWRWPAIRAVFGTAHHVFFVVSNAQLVIVARRLFGDPVAFRNFSRQAAQYHEQGRAIRRNRSV